MDDTVDISSVAYGRKDCACAHNRTVTKTIHIKKAKPVMTGELSIDTIKNASELVNTTLISKGYITEDLKFPVIDWEDLITDQPEKEALQKLVVADKIYNNDKNIINIIYSLTQSIDRHQAQQQSISMAILQKDTTIEGLQKKIQTLEQQVQGYEQKYEKSVYLDHLNMSEKITRLTKLSKTQAKELAKLKNTSSELQTKYDIEMRKKAIEISQLKNKLLDTRNLSNTITYVRPSRSTKSASPNPMGQEFNPNVVYNNKPIIDNSATRMTSGSEDSSAIIKQEYDGIATQLSELIENLMKENSKFSNFINELNEYFTKFNSQLSILNYKNLNASTLLNPSDEIDLNRILKDTSTEIDPFEFTSRPLLSNVYKNYHYVSGLIDLAASTLAGHEQGTSKTEDNDTLQKLKEENKALYNNWQSAIKALDDWKSYKGN